MLEYSQIRGTSKVLVFMATQDMVDYFTELLPRVMDPEVELFKLHGNMSHSDRTEVFKSFRLAKSGILFSTVSIISFFQKLFTLSRKAAAQSCILNLR